MKNYSLLTALSFTISIGLGACTFGEETTTEKLQTVGNKATDATKRTYRNAKDEICEMIDGKVKCLAQKAVNQINNAADKIETNATDAKNKVD